MSPDEPIILFLTQDLMIQSKASAAANGTRAKIVAIPSLEKLRIRLDELKPIGLFVDLQLAGFDIQFLSEILQQTSEPPHTIAFAQHVEVDLLHSAKVDSIAKVLTRGQFSVQLPELVSKMLA